MYRLTRKAAQQRDADRQRRAHATRARNRRDAEAPQYPSELPDLRMRIIVERLDVGLQRHVIELHRTRRVDVYAVVVDGQPWRRCGLTGVLEGIRKALPRVASPRSIA